jgi:hypothetical protein
MAFSRFSGLATMPLTASDVYRPWVIKIAMGSSLFSSYFLRINQA